MTTPRFAFWVGALYGALLAIVDVAAAFRRAVAKRP